MEEQRNSPIPFIIFAALVGLLFGNWWLGAIIGVVMTIVPGLALIALWITHLLNRIVVGIIAAIGFPFYLAFTGIRRLLGRAPVDDED
jgi:hypothetical protein